MRARVAFRVAVALAVIGFVALLVGAIVAATGGEGRTIGRLAMVPLFWASIGAMVGLELEDRERWGRR